MIERVEQLHTELAAEPLRDLEPLAQRCVHVEEMGAEERVASHIAEGPRRRTAPRTARATVRVQQRRRRRGRLATRIARVRWSGHEPGLLRRIIQLRVS